MIQLNRLNWRDFLERPNPVATALMAKMNIAPVDRPRVKAQCLRLLVTLKLDPARMQLISGFIDTYLKLTPEEETTFTLEIRDIAPQEQEQVMEIVTSWMERGIEQGLERGRQEVAERELAIFLQLLEQRLEERIPEFMAKELKELSLEQIEAFGQNLLGYEAIADVLFWLYSLGTLEQQHQRCTKLLTQQLGDLPASIQQQLESLTTEALAKLSTVQLDLASVDALQSWLDRDLGTEDGGLRTEED